MIKWLCKSIHIVCSKYSCIILVYFGSEVRIRPSADTSSMVIIPRPDRKIPTKVIHGWRAYINSINPVAFQIWQHPTNGEMFELVYQYKYQPNKTGFCEITLPIHERTQLEANGVIGIASYSRSPIPFSEYTCGKKYLKPRMVDEVNGTLGTLEQFSRELKECRSYSLQVSFACNFTIFNTCSLRETFMLLI